MNQKEAEKKMLDAWADFIKESELPPDNFPSPALGRAWIISIIAAIEEERAACAEILEIEARRYEDGHPGPTARKVAELLLTLATKIRARSEGVKT